MNSTNINSLVESTKQGSQSAFNKLYRYYKPLIWKIIYNMIHNKDLADDLSSIVFTKIYTKINSYTDNISFEMWIKTITINSVIDYIRKYKYEKLNEYIDNEDCKIQLEEVETSPEEKSIIKEQLDLVINLIPTLKRSYREVLLAKIEGLTYKEIAQKLNIDEDSVKSILNKSRQILRRKVNNFNKIKSSQ